MDCLNQNYKDPGNLNLKKLVRAFMEHTSWNKELAEPYFIEGSEYLHKRLAGPGIASGITLSTPGFYAPQVRSIRLQPMDTELVSKLGAFSFEGMQINNFEMESSALYALSAMLKHQAITICVAIANRVTLEFLEDYHGAVDQLIVSILDKLTQDE